jgi:F-type H+-transporting ATPase subunit epsilon
VDKLFLLEIVTPYGLVGSQGDFGVLPGHAPFLTSLRIGEFHYRQQNEVHFVSVNHGFAEVTPTKTTVLTDTAELAGEIDLERARAAKARAEEKIRNLPKEDPAYLQEVEALERARLRIRVAEKAPRD